jgi:hypothetical protein
MFFILLKSHEPLMIPYVKDKTREKNTNKIPEINYRVFITKRACFYVKKHSGINHDG